MVNTAFFEIKIKLEDIIKLSHIIFGNWIPTNWYDKYIVQFKLSILLFKENCHMVSGKKQTVVSDKK